jgi:hypothetical protein
MTHVVSLRLQRLSKQIESNGLDRAGRATNFSTTFRVTLAYSGGFACTKAVFSIQTLFAIN